jgi:CRISPR type III-A-associated protein Csm2
MVYQRGHQEQRRPPAGLPPGYLRQGYFDAKGNLRPEVITSLAENVARALGDAHPPLASTQLRRFYTKARFIKQKLDSGIPWEKVASDIHSLKRDAADSVGKEKAPRIFKDFIDINVDLGAQSKDSFVKGFLEHFQSVVAYRKYHESASSKY